MRRDQPSSPPHRAIATVSLLVGGTFWLTGCAAPPHAGAEAARTDRTASPAASAEADRWTAAERSRQLLLGSEVGLEVREWIIESDSHTIAQAIAAFRADGDGAGDRFVDPELAEHLRINGLRLVPVRVDDLGSLEAALGFATLNRRGWYGQLAEWMPLHGRRADGSQQAVFIDSRAQRFDRGEYRLMARAWVLPMEDGPRLNLQLVPEYQPPQRESLHHLLARPTHDGMLHGKAITSITADLLLEPDYALILTGEMPNVDWKEPDNNSMEGNNDRHDHQDSEDEDDADDAPDSDRGYLGPYVEMPQTLGEMLFTLGGVRGGRGMLIFVPRIPPEMRVGIDASRHEETP